MKQILVLALAAVTFASCQQNGSKVAETTDSTSATVAVDTPAAVNTSAAASPDAAVLTFKQTSYDFGTIKQGEKVNYDFKFTNTGKTPLIVSNATASCGCTVPETPKDPIAPGKEGVIKVVFNSTGKTGKQDKVITVSSNGNPAVNEVHLVGEVSQP